MSEKIIIKDPLDSALIRLGRFSSITEGGLLRPRADRYKNMFGTVLQVGSAFHPKDYVGRDVRPGDIILFDDWLALTAVPEVGKNLNLVKFDHVIGWLIGDGQLHDDRWAEEMLSEAAQTA